MQHFFVVLHFYLAFETSTGQVERTLGVVKAAADAHNGDTTATANVTWVSAELLLDGPAKESELFTKVVGAGVGDGDGSRAQAGNHFLLTPFSRLLCRLWLRRHGRRFHVYKVRKDRGLKRTQKKGSEAYVVSRMASARRQLAAGEGTCKKLLGSKAKDFVQKSDERFEKSRVWNTKLQRAFVLAKTRERQRKAMAEAQASVWKEQAALRRGDVVGEGVGAVVDLVQARDVRTRWSLSQRSLHVFYACMQAPASTPPVYVDEWRRSDPQAWLPLLRRADLVVLEDASDLDFSDGHGLLG